jgi:hypothetical protein
MRSTFPSASYPACGDDRMYDLHHGLLGAALFVGFSFAGPGYLGVAGWLIFVATMFWYGREVLRPPS